MRGLRILRSRLFFDLYATYVAVLCLTAVLVGVLVDQRLRTGLFAELVTSLEDGTFLLQPLAEDAFLGGGDPRSEVRELGRATGHRITLILPDGRVVADSEADPRVMEDHGSRPEVLEARERPFGVRRRHSRTLGREMLYVARRVEGDGGELLGFVRLALPARAVDAQLADARSSVVFGTLAGLLFALVLGFVFARRFTRPVAAITRVAEDLRAGRFASRVRIEQQGELDRLADTLNRLAEEVTDRIARISREDAQLRAMLAGMVEGVVAVGQDDRIAFCNTAARRLLELGEGPVEGRKLWEVAPIVPLEELLEKVSGSQTPSRRQIELFRGERERVLDVHASPFEGGGAKGLVIVMHDVSDLRRLERVRRDFVANVSHELKTPLAAIKGFVETLLSGALHDERHNERFVQRIHVNVERLAHLVSDLLSLARVESQHDGIHLVSVEWGAVLEEVARRHEEALRQKGLELEITAEEPVVVAGDREAMVQVLENLLDNAIKYTPPPGTIRMRLSSSAGRGLLEVEDTGIGIPREHIDRVFERFYRVDKARSRELGGTGLGLSIVKNLVRKMRGEVRVESQEGRGTRFMVELPLA